MPPLRAPRTLLPPATLAVALALAPALAPTLGAQGPVTAPATLLDFIAAGSLWGPGASTSYTTTTNWGKSFGVSKSVDGGSGFEWELKGSANVSYNFAASAQVTGGSYAAAAHASARTEVRDLRPELRAGDRVTLRSEFEGEQAKLSTTDSDFGLRTVFSGSFSAEARAKGCVPVLGCESESKSVNASVTNRDLVSLNWNGDGKVKFGGSTIPFVQFGRPLAMPSGAGAILADVPQIDGQSAVGARKASTMFEDKSMLHLAVDPVKAALSLSRRAIPCLTDCSFKIPVIDKKFEWTLIDLDVYLDLGVRQTVDLITKPFTIYDFSAPVRYRSPLGGSWETGTSVRVDGSNADLRFELPADEALRVSTRYGMTGTVTNRTYMTFGGSGDVEALEARLAGHGFGPLLDEDLPRVNASVKLFDSTFDIDFGMRAGSEFFLELTAPEPAPPPGHEEPPTDPQPDAEDPTPPPPDTVPGDPLPEVETTTTPEPATALLLGAGLAAIAAGAARRRSR